MPASRRRSVRGSVFMTGELSSGLLTAETCQCEDCGYLNLGVYFKGLPAHRALAWTVLPVYQVLPRP